MSAGVYVPERFPDRQFPRVQIATIEDLLSGRGPDLPRLGLADAPTFRRAARRRAASASRRMLLGVCVKRFACGLTRRGKSVACGTQAIR